MNTYDPTKQGSTLWINFTDTQQHLVIALHGFGGNAEDMLPVAKELTAQRPDICVASLNGFKKASDIEGHPYPDKAFTWEDSFQATHELFSRLQETDFKSISLLGFSEGAFLASSLIMRRPDNYQTAVLMGACHFLNKGHKSSGHKPNVAYIVGQNDAYATSRIGKILLPLHYLSTFRVNLHGAVTVKTYRPEGGIHAPDCPHLMNIASKTLCENIPA